MSGSSRLSDVVRRERDDDELSIIDFEFDDAGDEKWLCPTGSASRRNSTETKVEDLDAWLHADVQESADSQAEISLRKSIDTRTFTRMKRRSNKLNFDGTESESSPFTLSDVWKNRMIPESTISPTNKNLNQNDKEQTFQRERRDNVPMMLRPKQNQVLSALLSESPTSISSQASMEAFMNAATREGMSMLSDISDPDIGSYLMNVSQPSLLYSSIMSESRGDESLQIPLRAETDNMADSQILTDSMMEASMFKEVQDSTMLADFLKQNQDCSLIEDKTFTSLDAFDLNDRTFINDLDCDKTFENVADGLARKLQNDTFSNFPSPIYKTNANSTKTLSSQENLLDATQILATPSSLNSTRNLDTSRNLENNHEILSSTQTLDGDNKTDLTFDLKASLSSIEERLNSTFPLNSTVDQLPLMNRSQENGESAANATFDAIPNLREVLLQEAKRSSGNKFDSTFTNTPNVELKLNVTYDRPSSAEPIDKEPKALDSTYVQVSPPRQPESRNVRKALDETYDTTQANTMANNQMNIRRMNTYTKNNGMESQALGQNRFNTFKKEPKFASRLSKLAPPQESQSNRTSAVPLQQHVPVYTKNNDNNMQRYNTFTKKMSLAKNDKNACNENNLDGTFVKTQPKMDSTFLKPPQHMDGTFVKPQQNMDSTFLKPPQNMDGTFVKPQQNMDSTFVRPPVRQIQAPRQLSKLPSLFQKSNPNLGSNLKPLGKIPSDLTYYNKGSQPNMYALGRHKSEQRLMQTKPIVELTRGDSTSRSMESIESSASAHSAPDFDDRLSMGSTNSRASYTIKPRSIERVASMDDQENFGGSTPKVKGRAILENTWVAEKDLPSPILKNGVSRSYTESGDSLSTSPSEGAEFVGKTSSPLTISPASSDQAMNSIGTDSGDLEAAKENIQGANNVKPKPQLKPPTAGPNANAASKLRRPMNWMGANKAGNGAASGIPRPASRIPAPKFAKQK